MPVCYMCEVDKPIEAFSVKSDADNGHQSHCRECEREYRRKRGLLKPDGWERKTADMAAYQKAYRANHRKKMRKLRADWEKRLRRENPERWREIERKRYERRRLRDHGPDWQPRPRRTAAEKRESLRLREKRRREKHPEKMRARYAIKLAVKTGKLVRLPCVNCGDPKSHGHHPDYAKPLEVVWLCAPCHRAVHKLADADSAQVSDSV